MNSNNKSQKTAITPTRQQDYPKWYQEVIKAADLAEVSPTRGCMTIKPWGYAIWENMQRILDDKIKSMGHKNVYFPLLIPLSYMQKEAEHIEGFAKECAVVTHHRLKQNENGQLIPDGVLEEPYVIRPTSETIIGEAFSRWVQSYRDLPLLINQWANVVRWEMRTRLFLRTTEFLWQEGHTAHATSEEAMQEARAMLDVYAQFAEDFMSMSVIKGEKTESERFPGAVNTYCIEAMMQDKKALQAGTSHFLGQHFSRGFNIKYLSKESREEFAWTTSWGVTTRLIGGLIMSHSDDDGLIVPPKLAPVHVVILPIIHDEEQRTALLEYCDTLAKELRSIFYHTGNLKVEIDNRDMTGGEKAWGWVKKGVPIRLEIGKKECANQTVFMGRRDKPYKERITLDKKEFVQKIIAELDDVQTQLLQRSTSWRENNTQIIKTEDDFYSYFKEGGGFALAYWKENKEIEAKIKSELSVTARCIPLSGENQLGECIFSGEQGKQIIFGKAY